MWVIVCIVTRWCLSQMKSIQVSHSPFILTSLFPHYLPLHCQSRLSFFFFFFGFVGCNQLHSLFQVSLAFFPMREWKPTLNLHRSCLDFSSVSTLLLHSYSVYPPSALQGWSHSVECEPLFQTQPDSDSLHPLGWLISPVFWGKLMSQCWSRGGDHMTLQSRQAQGSNVIRECSCVSALLNTLLRWFQGRTRQPCHFVHFRLSSRARAPFSLFLLSVTLSQC